MKSNSGKVERLAFIGFGEAAAAFVSGWGAGRPLRLTAFDIDGGAVMQARYAEHDVAGCETAQQALAGVDAVFSVVTADQALIAASAAADGIAPGAFWFDCNSCAPGTKRRAAEVIEKAGGRYVDVAVMAPVYPKRHRVPMLVSGPHAEDAAAALQSLDMCPQIAGSEVGQASSIKMIRSVMVKGIEALTAECFLAAQRAGVEESVIASLEASDPAFEWRRRGAYNLERMMVHGMRRAAEMREVALTIQELGFSGAMSSATAQWQERIGALHADPGTADLKDRLKTLLDRM
ncbi:NAD(P)-dependent oxidoreductase [Rhizobium cremeum]|uniref:NAD(P)-dependent oxidoreductase n=1 Tax=Rhizobium cremeum TaxID=2813827 RepID=UPI000DDF811D